MLPNCTLRIVKMVNFMLCVFYNLKKRQYDGWILFKGNSYSIVSEHMGNYYGQQF